MQEALGHESIETTQLYQRCILPEDAVSPIGRVRCMQRGEPASVNAEADAADPPSVPERPTQHLFDEPLNPAPAELPFRDETRSTAASMAAAFHRLIKVHLVGRFLATRRASARGT